MYHSYLNRGFAMSALVVERMLPTPSMYIAQDGIQTGGYVYTVCGISGISGIYIHSYFALAFSVGLGPVLKENLYCLNAAATVLIDF